MPFFKAKEQAPAPAVDFDHLPRHIAIIMDGNGRWAQKRGLPRTAGHAAGAENFRTIATYCKDIGLEYLTVYAFSTENWKRPAEEVGAIMGLLKKYLLEAISRMERDRVKMEFFGDLSPLPQELQDEVNNACVVTWQEYIKMLEEAGAPGAKICALWRDCMVEAGAEMIDGVDEVVDQLLAEYGE